MEHKQYYNVRQQHGHCEGGKIIPSDTTSMSLPIRLEMTYQKNNVKRKNGIKKTISTFRLSSIILIPTIRGRGQGFHPRPHAGRGPIVRSCDKNHPHGHRWPN